MSTTSSLYSPYAAAWVQTKATDADGNTVKYIFEFFNGDGPTVSGHMHLVGVRLRYDGRVSAGHGSAGQHAAVYPGEGERRPRRRTVDELSDPAADRRRDPGRAAGVLPGPYVNNTWQDTSPAADIECTVTATGTGYNAPGYIRISVDGVNVATNYTGGADGQSRSPRPATPRSPRRR